MGPLGLMANTALRTACACGLHSWHRCGSRDTRRGAKWVVVPHLFHRHWRLCLIYWMFKDSERDPTNGVPTPRVSNPVQVGDEQVPMLTIQNRCPGAPVLFPDAPFAPHDAPTGAFYFSSKPSTKEKTERVNKYGRHHAPSLLGWSFPVTVNPDQQRIQKNCPETASKQVPTSVGNVYHHVQPTHQETVWYLGTVNSTQSSMARLSRNLAFRPGASLSKPRKNAVL